MKGRNVRVLANLAFFAVLLVLMIGWTLDNVVSIDRIEQPYELAAEFPNAFGVLPNAEVTYLGVNYGSVSDVERIAGGVRVTMQIERDKRIPDESTASILRKSAIGEQFVDFAPPPDYAGDDGPYYEAGEVVPRERTTVPLEFSELLKSASNLVAAVPPEDVTTVVHELAEALEGREQTLVQLADAGDRLSSTFASRTELLDRLADNNTRITRIVTEHRDSLGASLTDLRAVAQTLREAKGDVSVLLDEGSAFLGETADLVANQKGTIDCSLKVLEQLVDETTTPRRLAELRTLLTYGPLAFNRVWDARDVEADGSWLRVGFVANDTNPPPQFVPPKEQPPVRRVPVCASPLRVSGVDYRPGSPLPRASTAPLPATGTDNGRQTGGLLLLAAAVAARLAGRAGNPRYARPRDRRRA